MTTSIYTNWQMVDFENVCDFTIGRTPSRNEPRYWKDGRIPWVSIKDMADQPVIAQTKEAISLEAFKSVFRGKSTPAGTLLMSFKLTIGRTSILGIDAVHNEAIISIKPKPNVDRDFLFHLLPQLDYDTVIDRVVKGKTLNSDKIRRLSFRLPPLSEQKAIAKVLKAIQDAKEVRRREIELERERKAAMMEFLFTHGTEGEPLKDTAIGKMPRSWEVKKLGEVADVKGGKRLPKGEPFAIAPTAFPYIRIVDLGDGTIRTTDLKYLSPEIQAQIKRYTIAEGDVYISIAGTIGLCGTVPRELSGANLTENAAKLVVREPKRLWSVYLANYLSGNRGQAQISNLTAKTTQPKLALTRIEQIQIPYPDEAEQRRISGAISACQARLDALRKEQALLDELFRAILEELMSGRLSAIGLIENSNLPTMSKRV